MFLEKYLLARNFINKLLTQFLNTVVYHFISLILFYSSISFNANLALPTFDS